MDNENITLSDVALMVQIIDACSKRGAFEGNELVAIGQLRDKMERVVKANMPKEAETKEEQTEE